MPPTPSSVVLPHSSIFHEVLAFFLLLQKLTVALTSFLFFSVASKKVARVGDKNVV